MAEKNIFHGLITALITPFKNDKLDFDSLEKLIEFQIKAGADALVVGGSTGEGSSLDAAEYDQLITSAIKMNKGRLPIIAGNTAVSTREAVGKAKRIEALGADGLMCTPPHYIRPMQAGIYEHFKHIHEATNLPIMLYSHLGRTGTDFSNDTIIELAKLERIIALKDAGIDINRVAILKSKLPTNFSIMTGNDENTVAFNAHGGNGCISVASNIVPDLCKILQNKCEASDFKGALKLQQDLFPFYNALFLESNPIGVKYAAHLLGLCSDEVRLPLTQAAEKTKMEIETTVNKLVKV